MTNALAPRVAAYATAEYIGLARFETVYFVDGPFIYTCGSRPFNDAFNPANTEWLPTDAVPADAYFIGHYAPPVVA